MTKVKRTCPAKYAGRVPLTTDPTNPDTDGDGLLDGEEIDPAIKWSEKRYYSAEIGEFVVDREYFFTMYSDPNNPDTDGDGIDDEWDMNPLVDIDPNFTVIDNIENYGIDYLISDEYQKIMERAEESYDSIESDWNDGLKDEFINYLMSIGGATPLSMFVLEFDSNLSIGATPNGAEALFHYLQNDGSDVCVMLSIPLGLVKTQRKKYYDQMNSFFNMAEDTIKPGNTYSFATTKTPDETWFVNYHEKSAASLQIANDWWLTFGGAYNALVAEVSGFEGSDNKMHYTAKIKYYIYDYYDWDNENEKGLADLHKYGKAKSFMITGSYSFDINWIEGKRYPTTVDGEYPLSTTEFDGINDNGALKNAYDYGNKYYDNVNGIVYPYG